MRRHALLALLAVACLTPIVDAQAQTVSTAKDPSVADLYIDFSVPDVAALGLFGVNPNTVTRPGNLKEFSLAVLPLAAGSSDIGGGIALSWAPVYTFAHSVKAYQEGFARRLAFSLATTKDSQTSEVTVAAGARIVLRDDSDPVARADIHEQIRKLLRASRASYETRATFQSGNNAVADFNKGVATRMTSDPEKQATLVLALGNLWNIEKADETIKTAEFESSVAAQVTRVQALIDEQVKGDASLARIDLKADDRMAPIARSLASAYVLAVAAYDVPAASIRTRLAKVRQDFLDNNWNKTVATIDVGELSSSASGTWGDMKGQKAGAAFLLALPAGKSAQFVAQVQARKGFGSAPDETSFYSGGGRLLVGGAAKRFSIEGLVSKANDIDPQKNGVSKRATIGTEIRVSDGLWIELAVGSEWTPANANSGSRLLSLANLKYAFNSKPRFDQIPGAVPDGQ
jgi:hypothetical protein